MSYYLDVRDVKLLLEFTLDDQWSEVYDATEMGNRLLCAILASVEVRVNILERLGQLGDYSAILKEELVDLRESILSNGCAHLEIVERWRKLSDDMPNPRY